MLNRSLRSYRGRRRIPSVRQSDTAGLTTRHPTVNTQRPQCVYDRRPLAPDATLFHTPLLSAATGLSKGFI